MYSCTYTVYAEYSESVPLPLSVVYLRHDTPIYVNSALGLHPAKQQKLLNQLQSKIKGSVYSILQTAHTAASSRQQNSVKMKSSQGRKSRSNITTTHSPFLPSCITFQSVVFVWTDGRRRHTDGRC